MVHEDDYMSSGTRSEVDWLEAQLTERLRNQKGMREINILNRIVRVMDNGSEIEADRRHAELITEQMTQWDGKRGSYKDVTTPGVEVDEERGDMKQELGTQQARAFRSMAARCLYPSLDQTSCSRSRRYAGRCQNRLPRRGRSFKYSPDLVELTRGSCGITLGGTSRRPSISTATQIGVLVRPQEEVHQEGRP